MVDTAEAPTRTALPASDERRTDRTIGPYRLLQVLGEGGMGTVYLAEQREPIERRVALKVIKLGMDSKAVIARFESERQALAMMNHPNIAKVLDAGTTDEGRPFFVMEYVPGVPITAYCDRHRLSTRERIELVLPVCRAIQHAHQKGVIHRDLKPSNVLVVVEDGVPQPRIIDFGVAKATHKRLTEKTLFTEQGLLVGTPEYMSPEQAEGSLDIDSTTDVYSLGVLLYELLTGSLPFAGSELRAAGYAGMLRIIRQQEPPKPSTRVSSLGKRAGDVADRRQSEPRSLSRSLQGDLDWVTLTCLEKDRTRRYQSATELAADLERHLTNEPIAASPPSPTYRVRKFVARHRGGVVVATAALLALGVALGATWSLYRRAEGAQRVAEWRAYQSQIREANTQIDQNNLTRGREILHTTSENLRGWEWRHLFARTGNELSRARLGEGPLRLVSPRGPDLLALDIPSSTHARQNGRASLFRISPLSGAAALVDCPGSILAVSADGRLVAYTNWFQGGPAGFHGVEDELPETARGRVYLLDLASGQVVDEMHVDPRGFERPDWGGARESAIIGMNPTFFVDHDGQRLKTLGGWFPEYVRVEMSPSGNLLAVWSWDNAIHVRDRSQGSTRVLRGPTDGITNAAFSAADDALAVVSWDGSIWAWDVQTGDVLFADRGTASTSAVAFSESGEWLAVGSRDGTIQLIDRTEGVLARQWSGHSSGVWDLAFSSSGETLLSAGGNEGIRLWDPIDGAFIADFRSADASIVSIGLVGEHLLTGASEDGEVLLWDLQRASLEQIPASRRALSFAEYRGQALVTLGQSGSSEPVRLIDIDSGDVLWELLDAGQERQGFGDTMGAGISPMGDRLLIDIGGGLQIRSREPGKDIVEIPGGNWGVFSPEGRRVVGSHEDGLRIWDAENGKILAGSGENVEFEFARWHPDGRHLITGIDGGEKLRVWSSDLEPVLDLPLDAELVGASFSRREDFLFLGVGDGEAQVWDSKSWRRVASLEGVSDFEILDAAFHPTEPRMVTSSFDGGLTVWNLENHESVVTLSSPPLGGQEDYEFYMMFFSPSWTSEVEFAADGSTLVGRGHEGSLWVYRDGTRR